jgi:hypothetical protein
MRLLSELMLPVEHPSDVAEAWKQAAFDAFPVHIAVLETQSTIVAVNAAWKRFSRAHQAPPFVWAGVGLNYRKVCRRSAAGAHEGEKQSTF